MTTTLTLNHKTLNHTIHYIKKLMQSKPNHTFMLSVDPQEEILSDHQRSTIHERINDFEHGKADVMDLDSYMQQRLCTK